GRLPVQLAVPSASTKLMDLTPLHSSVAVAAPVLFVVAATVHSNVMLAGQVIIGATVSLKSINCVQVLLLPQLSSAVQVRVIGRLPVQFAVPSVSTKLMDFTPLHSSVAVAAPVLFVVAATVHSRVMLAGQVIIGAT